MKRYSLMYFEISLSKSNSITIKKYSSYEMDTYAQAVACAYDQHELSWHVKYRNTLILCWNNGYSMHQGYYRFAIVQKRDLRQISCLPQYYSITSSIIDLTERRSQFKRSIKELIEHLSAVKWNEFEDQSLNASKWHQILSLPKGYRILQPGEIIEETDIGFNDFSSFGGKHWMQSIHWYDKGKRVEKDNGIGIVRDGVVTKRHFGLPRPLCARLIPTV